MPDGSLEAAVVEDGGRDEPQNEGDAEGQEDDVVEVAEEGDEIGDEVDGAEGVADDEGGEELGVPGGGGVFEGEEEGEGLAFEEAGFLAEGEGGGVLGAVGHGKCSFRKG